LYSAAHRRKPPLMHSEMARVRGITQFYLPPHVYCVYLCVFMSLFYYVRFFFSFFSGVGFIVMFSLLHACTFVTCSTKYQSINQSFTNGMNHPVFTP